MRMATSFIVGLAAVLGAASVILVGASPAGARMQDAASPATHADLPKPTARGERQAKAAAAFERSLSESERARAVRALDDPERTKWYFARGDRAGLFLRDMDEDTRAATLALVGSLLSDAGREQWRLIRVIEALNAEDERRAGVAPPTYGDDLYAVHLFGSPGASAWAFEIEGHHFVLHAASVDGRVTVTPAFTGSFPAAVPRGMDAGRRPLGAAVEVAFELARSLDEAQRAAARIMDRPPADVLWAVGADAKAPEPRGVRRAEMDDAQKALVDRLLAAHVALLDEEVADAQLRAWRERHAGEFSFAFVGDADLAKPHYYRLASPTFTIEYDSTNADASHVHCVWSDPASNFGGDALRAHLKAAHGAGAR